MSSPIAISIIFRLVQLSLAIIAIALAVALTYSYGSTSGYIASVIVVSCLSFVHFLIVMIPPVSRLVPFVCILLLELLMLGLWVLEFVFMVQQYATYGSCSGKAVYSGQTVSYSFEWCRLGKTLVAITLFNWLAGLATLIALFILSVIPVVKSIGLGSYLGSKRNSYILGCIFCKLPERKKTRDEEQNEKPVVSNQLPEAIKPDSSNEYTEPLVENSSSKKARSSKSSKGSSKQPHVMQDESKSSKSNSKSRKSGKSKKSNQEVWLQPEQVTETALLADGDSHLKEAEVVATMMHGRESKKAKQDRRTSRLSTFSTYSKVPWSRQDTEISRKPSLPISETLDTDLVNINDLVTDDGASAKSKYYVVRIKVKPKNGSGELPLV